MYREIRICNECESEYFEDSSGMMQLCPNCCHYLYGYPNCEHNLIDGRCLVCYWNGKTSECIKSLKSGK